MEIFFTVDQFVSTSVIRTKTLPGKYEFIIHIPKGCSAAYIEKISKYPKQREVLINKDAIYKLKSIKRNIIELEVIS